MAWTLHGTPNSPGGVPQYCSQVGEPSECITALRGQALASRDGC